MAGQGFLGESEGWVFTQEAFLPRQVKYSGKAQPGSHKTLSGSGLVESECYDQDFAHPNGGAGRLVPNCRVYGVRGMYR